jgi:hypothetical protein
MYFLLPYQTIKGKIIEEKIIIIKEKNNHSKTNVKSLIVKINEIMKSKPMDNESNQNKGCKRMKPASSLTLFNSVLGNIKLRKAI